MPKLLNTQGLAVLCVRANTCCKVELLLARSEVKWVLRACRYIHMNKDRSIVEDGKQFTKCRKGFEYLGKLLQLG